MSSGVQYGNQFQSQVSLSALVYFFGQAHLSE